MRYLLLSSALLFITFLSAQTREKEVSLFFDFGSDLLSALEEAKLDSFFATDSVQVSAIRLEGFCDDVGSEADNLILSRGRAENVAAYIKSSQETTAISAVGKGEIPLKGNSEIIQQRQSNRKVSALISYTLTPKPKPATVKLPEVDTYVGYKTLTDSLKTGDKLILRNLIFIGSTTVFEDPEVSEPELLKYAEYMKANPQIRFEIHGHVCCISKSFRDARNIYTGKNNLSVDRAKRIYDYFIEKGIDQSRMTYKGFGRQFPRTDVPEKFNKRVEIVITNL